MEHLNMTHTKLCNWKLCQKTSQNICTQVDKMPYFLNLFRTTDTLRLLPLSGSIVSSVKKLPYFQHFDLQLWRYILFSQIYLLNPLGTGLVILSNDIVLFLQIKQSSWFDQLKKCSDTTYNKNPNIVWYRTCNNQIQIELHWNLFLSFKYQICITQGFTYYECVC